MFCIDWSGILNLKDSLKSGLKSKGVKSMLTGKIKKCFLDVGEKDTYTG